LLDGRDISFEHTQRHLSHIPKASCLYVSY
jgi:hypothetical protein